MPSPSERILQGIDSMLAFIKTAEELDPLLEESKATPLELFKGFKISLFVVVLA